MANKYDKMEELEETVLKGRIPNAGNMKRNPAKSGNCPKQPGSNLLSVGPVVVSQEVWNYSPWRSTLETFRLLQDLLG